MLTKMGRAAHPGSQHSTSANDFTEVLLANGGLRLCQRGHATMWDMCLRCAVPLEVCQTKNTCQRERGVVTAIEEAQ
jgi:hypothetical protein